MKKLKDILDEVLTESAEYIDKSKYLSTSTINSIIKDIKRMADIDDHWSSDDRIDFQEQIFKDGQGGITFKWSKGRAQSLIHGSFLLHRVPDDNKPWQLDAITKYGKKKWGSNDEPIKIDIEGTGYSSGDWHTVDQSNFDMDKQIKTLWKQKFLILNQGWKKMMMEKEKDNEAERSFHAGGNKGYYKQDGRIGAGL